ncbi:ice-binding family protein [Flavobacterium degerlachei]|jgi:hypothetical protein|uniref:Ig-like domain-containing protein n=1 Tax=Flavobacterium degerlachei TaxID=229203 RepID=A0A1H2ZG10_9FLAO|nr:ice-binding family protein [Flavobacterium degerlachei]SDX15724.1 Protein of unknown function [Flavobacterium degerlachei]
MVKKLLFFILTYLVTSYSYSQTPDFKIQHLQFDVPGSGLTITAPTNFTGVNDLKKAFIIVSNNRRNGAGPFGSSSTIEARGMSCSVYFSNANTIVFSRGAGAAITTRVNIMIVEYIGSVGGPNEIIVRHRAAVTPVAGTAVQSLAMSATPANINKCIPFYSVQTTDTQNGGAANSLMLYCSGTNTLNYHRGGATNTVSARVEVVEFTGSNWSVGHGDSGTGGSDSGTITLNSSATGTGGSIFDVGSYSNAFIWHTYKGDSNSGANEAIADNYPIYTPNGTTKVNWNFNANHDGSSERHFVHVLVNSSMNVTRFSDTQSLANESIIDISTAGLTDLGQSLILGSSYTSGTGTAYGRGWRNYYFNSLNEAAHWSHRSGNTLVHEIQIIDFIGLSICPYIIRTTPRSRNGAGTLTLNAKASAGTLNWYAASTGGTSLGTGTSFITPSISTTTTYYVDVTNNGCTSATRTAVLATINSPLNVTPSTLDFGYVPSGSTSSTNNYTLSGQYLSSYPGNITVTAPSNFQVSLSPSSGFSSSLIVPFSTANLSETIIYVQFLPTVTGVAYTGDITNSGGGGTAEVTVNGSSMDLCDSNGNMEYSTSITSINFNTISNTSAKPSSYSDYTSQITDVKPGSSYPLVVNINTDGDYTVFGKAWIDWNQDGDFEDANETFDLGSATNVPNGSTDGSPKSITIPCGAAIGKTRMRVSAKWQVGSNSCDKGFDGEVEDYTLNIVQVTPTTTASAICIGSTASLSAAGAVSGEKYRWYNATVGGTLLKTSPDNSDNSYTTEVLVETAIYWVSILNAGGCESTRTKVTATINPIPSEPGAITGTATQCPALASQTYSISAVANASTYNWTVPTGWSITAGSGTTSITVTTGSAGQNGNITVTAGNSCGTSSAQSLAVTVSPAAPVTPGTITGTATQCPSLAGESYSISNVNNASTYTWTVPTGWAITAGQNTTSITVTTGSVSQNGNITVTAANTCGTSSAQTLAVTVNAASVGGTASANQNICSGSTPTNITLSGQTGTIQWQSSSDNTTFTNIASATASTLTGSQMGILTATMYYRAVVTSEVCTSANSNTIIVTVNAIATITGTTAGSRTGTGTVTLGATASVGDINWYATASGGVSLGSGETFNTPAISSTTSYYAEATNGVCTAVSRNKVVASVTIEVSGPLLDLGILTNFAAYTVAGAVTNSGTSTVSGDIGSNNGVITGFGAPTTAGTIYNADATTAQAKIDLLRVYIHLSDVFVTNTTHAAAFGGETLTAGVYAIAGAGSLTGPITLDGQGNANAIFIIKFEGAFTVAANSKIILANGARACNVFWIAQGAISAGASSDLKGTLIAYPGAITVPTGSNLEGRMLSSSGAINFGPGALSVPEGPIAIPIKCDNSCNNNILGTVANFVLFTSAGAVANNGPSGIVGDIGSDSGAISGFESSTIEGSFYNVDAVTAQAKIDLQAAYTQLIDTPSTNTTHTPAFGGGETLTAGVYSIGGAGSLAGTLTLDGQGDPDALFILRFTGAFATAAQSKVILTNGVRRCNVFWIAEGAISMGAFSYMKGTLIAHGGANTMGANGNLEGRMLSTAGAIGFSTGVIYNNTLCFNEPINKWKGTINTIWNIPGNWTRNIVPAADDNIIFDEAPVNHCFMYQDRSVTNITNAQSLYGVVLNGNKLTLKGDFLFSNGATIYASAVNSTIQFSGSTVQTINSSEFKNNEVYNLNINNSNNVVLNGNLRLLNKLTTTTGLLDAFTNAPLISYAGSDVQTIESNQFLGEKVYDLTVDNTVGVKLNTNFSITNTLLINANKIVSVSPLYQLTAMETISNNAGASGLVLKSDATGTASLLHNSNNVPATVQRYISGPVEGWHFLSSPVSNQAISGSWLPVGSYGTGDPATGTGYDLYLWDEPSFSFKYKQDASSIGWNSVHPEVNFTVGRGYLYSVQETNPTKEFLGNLNNGSVNYPITSTATLDPALVELRGFNLVGNPYPSSVDWQAASGWDRTLLEDSAGGTDMWVWNPTANNYGVFNSASGVGSNSITRFLAPMQGYFVKAANDGYFAFDNSTRVHTGAGNWFKTSRIKNGLIRIAIQSQDGNGGDEALIQFGYSDSIQGTSKLFSHVGTAPSLYMKSSNKDYSVRYLTNTSENPSVALEFKAGKDGFYNLKFDFDSKEFDFVQVEDRLLKTYTSVKPLTSYEFESSKADDVNRFILHFTEADIKTVVEKELAALVYMDGKRLVIDLKAVVVETEVTVFGIAGRLIFRKKLKGSVVHKLNVNSATQILLVRLKNEKGTLNTKVFYDLLK